MMTFERGGYSGSFSETFESWTSSAVFSGGLSTSTFVILLAAVIVTFEQSEGQRAMTIDLFVVPNPRDACGEVKSNAPNNIQPSAIIL